MVLIGLVCFCSVSWSLHAKKTNLGQFLVLQFGLWFLRSTPFSTAKWKCYQNNHINYKIWLRYGFYKFGEVCGYVCLKNTVWGPFCPQNRVFWRFQAKPIQIFYSKLSRTTSFPMQYILYPILCFFDLMLNLTCPVDLANFEPQFRFYPIWGPQCSDFKKRGLSS